MRKCIRVWNYIIDWNYISVGNDINVGNNISTRKDIAVGNILCIWNDRMVWNDRRVRYVKKLGTAGSAGSVLVTTITSLSAWGLCNIVVVYCVGKNTGRRRQWAGNTATSIRGGIPTTKWAENTTTTMMCGEYHHNPKGWGTPTQHRPRRVKNTIVLTGNQRSGNDMYYRRGDLTQKTTFV